MNGGIFRVQRKLRSRKAVKAGGLWTFCVVVGLLLTAAAAAVAVIKGSAAVAALLVAPLMYIVKCCYCLEKTRRLLELYEEAKNAKDENIRKDILAAVLEDIEDKSLTTFIVYLFPFHRENKT